MLIFDNSDSFSCRHYSVQFILSSYMPYATILLIAFSVLFGSSWRRIAGLNYSGYSAIVAILNSFITTEHNYLSRCLHLFATDGAKSTCSTLIVIWKRCCLRERANL